MQNPDRTVETTNSEDMVLIVNVMLKIIEKIGKNIKLVKIVRKKSFRTTISSN